MKRIVIGAVIVIGLIGTANAQPSSATALANYSNLGSPVTLAAPGDLPDVAECRGILSQEILDIVNAAGEDPHDRFEQWRAEHHSMVEESLAIECQSKLWQ